jgi:hypothetical protein
MVAEWWQMTPNRGGYQGQVIEKHNSGGEGGIRYEAIELTSRE